MGAEAQAIEEVYRARYGGFSNALATVTGSHESARDAVQESFAIALAKRAEFRGGSLEAWIWRIALSCALDGRRRARRLALNGVPETVNPQLPDAARDPELAAAVEALAQARAVLLEALDPEGIER